jgi:hypothetical protein
MGRAAISDTGQWTAGDLQEPPDSKGADEPQRDE